MDHDILINRLRISFGVRGTARDWIDSFIRKRTQMVNYNGQTSTSSDIECGVPQGSLLDTILFLLYTADVPNIVQQHELSSHTYANDTQLYAHCKAQSCQETAVKVTECIKDIDRWMSSNLLKLNGDKTQFIWPGTWQQLAKVQCSTIRIGDVNIRMSTQVTCLGVVLDSEIKLTRHVRRLAGRCLCYLRQLWAVRRSVTADVAKHW